MKGELSCVGLWQGGFCTHCCLFVAGTTNNECLLYKYEALLRGETICCRRVMCLLLHSAWLLVPARAIIIQSKKIPQEVLCRSLQKASHTWRSLCRIRKDTFYKERTGLVAAWVAYLCQQETRIPKLNENDYCTRPRKVRHSGVSWVCWEPVGLLYSRTPGRTGGREECAQGQSEAKDMGVSRVQQSWDQESVTDWWKQQQKNFMYI